MTTRYDTKEEALEMGACYAGYSDANVQRRVLAEATVDTLILGWPHSRPATEDCAAIEKRLETYEISNSEGVKVRLGVSRFREGYDLWLITPEGLAQRT